MEEFLSTFIRAIFIDNMIFAYYLGMCSFFAISKNVKTSLGLGLTIVFILGVTVPINYLLEKYVLVEGALVWLDESFADTDLSFLSLILFITVIASFVQLAEMVIERFLPSLYASLGIFLPLLAVNCAILGGSLFMQQRAFPNIGTATVYGLGCGIGWLLAILGMAAISEKITYSNIPKPLRGLGIAFVITGLMGLGFMCFSGLKI
ncbi:NADH:ubiquinone reductase (Na(+)-transporting) subunit E [Massilibacteroides vaginae]|uniref:NADH:ubiquinone reductase (Na(+)-transporting) subunit E n=1 Tax=Massilibacteroides vaginae TaxID=1673718 RepID=UPI000A1CC0D1|nr:NADH:ubiquinone reductase (Na(+)-transporting) subunit E [Massilibacteroides vaginae]